MLRTQQMHNTFSGRMIMHKEKIMVSPLKTLLESKLGSKINRTLTLVARDYYFKGGELRPHRR